MDLLVNDLPPENTRWSLQDLTGCGQRGYMRPCQIREHDGISASAFPMARICETDAEAVLIVDDEAEVRMELEELVTSLGYSAATCRSSHELQEQVRRFSTGCILLDVKLPGLDGLATQEWLSKSKITLPVIFISGVQDIETAVQGVKAGAMDFLPKPLSDMTLREAVNAGIARSRMLHCRQQSARLVSGLVETLTPTEMRVARMISRGYPTKLIATELGRSENTIKIHRYRIFMKLKVNSSASVANLLCHIGARDG